VPHRVPVKMSPHRPAPSRSADTIKPILITRCRCRPRPVQKTASRNTVPSPSWPRMTSTRAAEATVNPLSKMLAVFVLTVDRLLDKGR
jgi:hypothetical protein